MILGETLLAAAAVPGIASLTPVGVVTVASRDIRLGAVVRAPGLTPAERRRVVARMPAGAASVTLPRRAVAALVHHNIARLRPAAGPGNIVFRLAPVAHVSAICFRLRQKVARGGVVGPEMAAPAPCSGQPSAMLRFADGALHATADLFPGDYLGAVHLTGRPAVQKGDALQIVSTVGPIRVVRAVTAMQDGRNGRRIFVRDEDGQVFAAPMPRSGESE